MAKTIFLIVLKEWQSSKGGGGNGKCHSFKCNPLCLKIIKPSRMICKGESINQSIYYPNKSSQSSNFCDDRIKHKIFITYKFRCLSWQILVLTILWHRSLAKLKINGHISSYSLILFSRFMLVQSSINCVNWFGFCCIVLKLILLLACLQIISIWKSIRSRQFW